MGNKAIIIVDMLNDFVTGELKCGRIEHIIPNLKRLVAAAHKSNVPVIYSNDAHCPQDTEVVQRWGEHAMKGTKGAEVIPELRLSEKDYVIEKRTYSGFYRTGMDRLLRELFKGEGEKTVILAGVHTHICIRHLAADSFFRGYRIIVAKDAVEAFSQEDHEYGLKYLQEIYNARLMTTDEIIAEFS